MIGKIKFFVISIYFLRILFDFGLVDCRIGSCATRSRVMSCYTIDITRCCATGSLPTHAELVTDRCGAVGTMNPWPEGLNRNREVKMKTASMNAVRELGWMIRQT